MLGEGTEGSGILRWSNMTETSGRRLKEKLDAVGRENESVLGTLGGLSWTSGSGGGGGGAGGSS